MQRVSCRLDEELALRIVPRFEPQMARGAAQRALARALDEGGIESARIDARVLLCSALGIDHAGLVRNPDRPLGSGAALVESFALRRLRREPVARIIGHRDFWRSRFKIGPAVLDPRPATETLISVVLDHAARRPNRNWRILDLGTGSGAILCSLLLSLPESFGIGVDISPGACAIARENLGRLGLARRGLIVCGDWTHALRGSFDVIVSNPPYIASSEILRLPPEVREHDPHLALDGGEDGLAAYREIVPASCNLLAPGGLIALEVGKDQHLAVESLLRKTFGAAVAPRLDLDGHWRVVAACFARPIEA
jgi:release factor glutamine methyltransferase